MHVNLTWNCRVLCGSGFSLFAVSMLSNPYHLRVNWPTSHCEITDGVHCFILNFECHHTYNKLLCNSENSDTAWWNKNNSEWVFSVFFEKRTQSCFILKNLKNPSFFEKKQKKQVCWFFWKKRGYSQPWYTLIPVDNMKAFVKIFNKTMKVADSASNHILTHSSLLGVESFWGNTQNFQMPQLILHQCNQGRYNNRYASQVDCWQLKTQRFASSSWHWNECILLSCKNANNQVVRT